MLDKKEIAATVKTEALQKKQLYLEICEISECAYCAGWAQGIEFLLWQAVLDDSETAIGTKVITTQEITHLRSLAEQSGGWWHWACEETEAVFITLDEWQEIYRQFLQGN